MTTTRCVDTRRNLFCAAYCVLSQGGVISCWCYSWRMACRLAPPRRSLRGCAGIGRRYSGLRPLTMTDLRAGLLRPMDLPGRGHHRDFHHHTHGDRHWTVGASWARDRGAMQTAVTLPTMASLTHPRRYGGSAKREVLPHPPYLPLPFLGRRPYRACQLTSRCTVAAILVVALQRRPRMPYLLRTELRLLPLEPRRLFAHGTFTLIRNNLRVRSHLRRPSRLFRVTATIGSLDDEMSAAL